MGDIITFVPQSMQLNEPPSSERVRSRLQRLNIALKKTQDPARRATLTAEVERLCGLRLPPTV
jgi:hypothetical protein